MYDNLKKLIKTAYGPSYSPSAMPSPRQNMSDDDIKKLEEYWLALIRQKHPEYFTDYPNLDLLQDPESPVGPDLVE